MVRRLLAIVLLVMLGSVAGSRVAAAQAEGGNAVMVWLETCYKADVEPSIAIDEGVDPGGTAHHCVAGWDDPSSLTLDGNQGVVGMNVVTWTGIPMATGLLFLGPVPIVLGEVLPPTTENGIIELTATYYLPYEPSDEETPTPEPSTDTVTLTLNLVSCPATATQVTDTFDPDAAGCAWSWPAQSEFYANGKPFTGGDDIFTATIGGLVPGTEYLIQEANGVGGFPDFTIAAADSDFSLWAVLNVGADPTPDADVPTTETDPAAEPVDPTAGDSLGDEPEATETPVSAVTSLPNTGSGTRISHGDDMSRIVLIVCAMHVVAGGCVLIGTAAASRRRAA